MYTDKQYMDFDAISEYARNNLTRVSANPFIKKGASEVDAKVLASATNVAVDVRETLVNPYMTYFDKLSFMNALISSKGNRNGCINNPIRSTRGHYLSVGTDSTDIVSRWIPYVENDMRDAARYAEASTFDPYVLCDNKIEAECYRWCTEDHSALFTQVFGADASRFPELIGDRRNFEYYINQIDYDDIANSILNDRDRHNNETILSVPSNAIFGRINGEYENGIAGNPNFGGTGALRPNMGSMDTHAKGILGKVIGYVLGG